MSEDNKLIDAGAYAVTVKIPQFMENSVSNWFLIAEAQFILAKISTAETKYYHIIANLPTTVLDKLDRTTISTPNYENLKKAIIEKFEKSKPELFRKMLQNKSMTGKPSFFMSELELIAEKVGVGADLVKHQFLEAVPPSISSVLLSHDDLSLTQMGKLADSMLPYIQNHEVHLADTTSNSRSRPMHRENDYNPNKANFHQNHSSKYNNRPNASSENPQVPFSVMPYAANQRPKICRAHLYFLDKARNCKPWCGYPNKNKNLVVNPSSRPSSPARPNNSEN